MVCKITNPATGAPGGGQSRAVALPKSEAEIDALLMDMGVGRATGYACEISDVNTSFYPLDERLAAARPTVDELNHIAKFLQTQNETDMHGLDWFIESLEPENGAALINALHNADDYTYCDCREKNFEGLGKAAVSASLKENAILPSGLAWDFESMSLS
jgi:hypothetical protein